MADDILEQIGKYRAPKKLPPISMQAFAMYEAEDFTISETTIEALRLALAEFDGDLKALTDANVGLGVFALYLRDTRKDAEGAEMVAALIRETAPKYQTIGERIVSALQDLAVNATALFERFTDAADGAKNRAPKIDEAAPEQTLPLKNIKPVGADLPVREISKKNKP